MDVRTAKVLLQRQSVLAIPTDTVWGFATLPENAQEIFDLKHRDPSKPINLLIHSIDQVIDDFDPSLHPVIQKINEKYWPGPVTCVFPVRDTRKYPPLLMNDGCIGLRIPNHPEALDLLEATGPLAASSANLSNELTLRTPHEIRECFGPDFPIYGKKQPKLQTPSTVLKYQDGSWIVIRR